MAASSGDGRGNFDRDSDEQECNGAHKRLRLMSPDANEASYQMNGVLHASSITVSFPAINPVRLSSLWR